MGTYRSLCRKGTVALLKPLPSPVALPRSPDRPARCASYVEGQVSQRWGQHVQGATQLQPLPPTLVPRGKLSFYPYVPTSDPLAQLSCSVK